MGNKIRLFYDENPQSPGLYQTDAPQLPAKTVAYNYTRSESLENNTIEFKGTSSSETVAGLIELLNQDNRINQLWKWFLIVTLCFVILEVLIQKLIK
jgi:flagellar biosynthesis/type III secretory pathway M-ring protein FliF/YscJ